MKAIGKPIGNVGIDVRGVDIIEKVKGSNIDEMVWIKLKTNQSEIYVIKRSGVADISEKVSFKKNEMV